LLNLFIFIIPMSHLCQVPTTEMNSPTSTVEMTAPKTFDTEMTKTNSLPQNCAGSLIFICSLSRFSFSFSLLSEV
jgi:hypothetical protein